MNCITSIYLIRILSLAGISLLASCGNFESGNALNMPYEPSLSIAAASRGSLNENSNSSATRKIVKKSKLTMDVDNVRSTGKKIEDIVGSSSIKGPLGAISHSVKWSLAKLFTIREHG